MNIDRAVLGVAGTIALVSVLAAVFVSSWWLALTTLVGFNLLQPSITGCPAALVFQRAA